MLLLSIDIRKKVQLFGISINRLIVCQAADLGISDSIFPGNSEIDEKKM